jgi:hypothetical protein
MLKSGSGFLELPRRSWKPNGFCLIKKRLPFDSALRKMISMNTLFFKDPF